MKYIIITFEVSREGDYYVSECRELGTSSFGPTEEEAIERVLDATEVYLNTLEDLGECDQVLKERGIRVHTGGAASDKVMCPPNASVHSGVIPLGILA
ncbi:MAG: type II toxin-antitoxin system HicB family antitoxin [Chloroflexota bacterium]|nr:type II toxin-antitoxin system HicB family antitoxin [Anaerolineae bacterium]